MTMMSGPSGADGTGESVASFPTYEAAQKAVSTLIAGDIPAREIAIVGYGLRSVERVTGRLGYAAAARSGAINGILLGLLFSAIFVLGSPSPSIALFLGVMFVGVAIGMLMSLLMYAIVRRRRDYASVMQVIADHYEVTVKESSIHRARQLMRGQSVAATPVVPAAAAPVAPAPAPASAPRSEHAEPPRYGERIPAEPAQEQSDDVSPEDAAGAEPAAEPVPPTEQDAQDAGADAAPDDAEQASASDRPAQDR